MRCCGYYFEVDGCFLLVVLTFDERIGLLPANFLHISTGATLTSAADATGGSNMLNFVVLFILQFVALLPTLFKGKIESYEQQKFANAKKSK